MASSTTATPGMNWIYQAPQIHIPPQLPHILKTYIKAAIRTQPQDLLAWSAYYFKCVHGGMVPPVKKHLEFPLFAGPGSFTPGYLAVLVKQLGREGFVPVPLLYEKWLGLTLNKDDLDRMLLLQHYPDKMMNIAEFIAIAAGHLCKTLSATMTLVCELLTLEPEGGNARIPLTWFKSLYQMLAKLDCGPARQDEIVVQNIILPFGAKESKLWSIPEGVPPDIRDLIRKHFQSVQSDIVGEQEEREEDLESFTLSSCVDISRIFPGEMSEETSRPKSDRAKKNMEVGDTQDHASTDGLQVWENQCPQKPFTSEDSCTDVMESDKNREAGVVQIVDETIHDKEKSKEREIASIEPVETLEGDILNMEEENEQLTNKGPFGVTSVPSIVSLPPINHLTEGHSQEDENLFSLMDQVPSGLVGFESVLPEAEDTSLSGGDSVTTANIKSIGDILLRYHVPGIGPKIPDWQIEQVFDFMLQVSLKQDGYVMPRNILHAACPPLDLIGTEECPESSERQQGSQLSEESCHSGSEISIRADSRQPSIQVEARSL